MGIGNATALPWPSKCSSSNKLSEGKLRFQCSVILSYRMNFALVALLNAFGDSRSDNNLEFSHKQVQWCGHCYHRYQRVNGLLKKNISTGRLPSSLTRKQQREKRMQCRLVILPAVWWSSSSSSPSSSSKKVCSASWWCCQCDEQSARFPAQNCKHSPSLHRLFFIDFYGFHTIICTSPFYWTIC